MSPKKQHEVTRMVNLLTNWFNDEKVQMLDCGSGKGHLARLLSLNRRFNVFTLEQQDDLRQKAQHYDRELLNSKEHKDGESDSLPRHLHFLLNDQNTYLVQSQLQGDFALIGLHSCGDLALSMLRFYHHSNTARALSLCFCCYHKANQLNCVLTDHLRSIGIELTMETRANACHAIETLLQTLRQEPHQILVHAYRSILEAILEQNRPEWRRRTLPKIRSAGKVDFNRYAQRAIRILNKDGSLDKTVFENSEAKRMLERSNQVTAFVCIRTLLGPLCETLLLLDKLLYVCQQVRGHAALFPLFDPHLSPRCFVLMATKCKEPL